LNGCAPSRFYRRFVATKNPPRSDKHGSRAVGVLLSSKRHGTSTPGAWGFFLRGFSAAAVPAGAAAEAAAALAQAVAASGSLPSSMDGANPPIPPMSMEPPISSEHRWLRGGEEALAPVMVSSFCAS